MSKIKQILSLDWLQLNTLLTEPIQEGQIASYQVKKQDKGTRVFKQVFELSEGKTGLATLALDPYSPVLDSNMCIIKFHNGLLYRDDREEVIKAILTALKLKFKGVTRVDIACDFHTLRRGLRPETFIKRFVNGDIEKVGRAKFQTRGVTSKDSGLIYQTLKFGSETSQQSYYLYNKSQELKDRKDKPYIRDFWELNGLEPDDQDVWRLEFSLKSDQADMIDRETGLKVGEFHSLDWLDDGYLAAVYQACLDKYWQFVKSKGAAQKRQRQRISTTVKVSDYAVIKRSKVVYKDSTRTDKICASWLKKLNDDLREIGGVKENITADIIDRVLYEHIFDRGLISWAVKKSVLPTLTELQAQLIEEQYLK